MITKITTPILISVKMLPTRADSFVPSTSSTVKTATMRKAPQYRSTPPSEMAGGISTPMRAKTLLR